MQLRLARFSVRCNSSVALAAHGSPKDGARGPLYGGFRMSEFRFIHSSDLHLGKGFGTTPEELRGRLKEARHETIARLAQAARIHGAEHILLAGDTFDTTGPSEAVRRQAARAMAAEKGLNWWVLPGNHDSLAGEDLWRQFEAEAGDSVHVLRTATPREITTGVQLLPSPWPRRFPSDDLTAWMAGSETPEGHFRIGLVHGGVTDFGENFDSSTLIPPNRAETAQLDYLALGDWHGVLCIGERTWYSGTPERDGFRRQGRGICLAVTLTTPGALPKVTEIDTGKFEWSAPNLYLSPGMDAAKELSDILADDVVERRNCLMRISAKGHLGMAERLALEAAAEAVAPDFGLFHLETGDLVTEYSADDLDMIAEGGALRDAADELRQVAQGMEASAEEARVAQAALNRLLSLVREV